MTLYIMFKDSIQEYITIINIYAPNIGAPQYVRQILTINGECVSSTLFSLKDQPDRK